MLVLGILAGDNQGTSKGKCSESCRVELELQWARGMKEKLNSLLFTEGGTEASKTI